MPDHATSTAHAVQVSTSQLAEFFVCSNEMARQIMRRVDIPKRGGGYSRQRLWRALGFLGPFPVDDDPLWQPLADVATVAKIAMVSEKTVGRMFDGRHADKTFENHLWLGPRKRLIFPFELQAWLTGSTPRFQRPVERIHAGLRPGASSAGISAQKPSRAGRNVRPTASLFLSPKSA
ncbi:hypothetical protein OE699_10620 [Sedimentimonas flavescens]|uniref:Uncharacterized protein n=1 Tax=Sedimentimonas flavescens TaxID=2851012 RepID=A0ABT3A0S0_9RHOB|nr:hypothetical protein [Sedimentimonas flavescens]MCV2879309.1 hypothetical protein [Sedimentimonas flavescens]